MNALYWLRPKVRRFAAWEQSELFTEEGCVPIASLTISESRARTWVCAVLSKRNAATKGEDDMSHHYSGPDFGFPHGDARLDLTDLYAFPKPGDAGKSILIMNVHPSVGLSPAGPTTDDPFATGGGL